MAVALADPVVAADSAGPAVEEVVVVLAGPVAAAVVAQDRPVEEVAAAAGRLQEEDKFIYHKQKPWIGVNTYRGF